MKRIYFLGFQDIKEQIEKIINDPNFIEPIERRNEIIKFCSKRLKKIFQSQGQMFHGESQYQITIITPFMFGLTLYLDM